MGMVQYDKDTVLIQYKETAYREMKRHGQLERKFQKHGLEDLPRSEKIGNFRHLKLTAGTVDSELERLRADKDVAFVARNLIFGVDAIQTGNPLVPYDRSKRNDRHGGYIGWAHEIVPQVDPDLEVAVCDQGAITTHEDITVHRTLRDTAWTSSTPSGAHGTLVSGCIAALDNSTGSYGVAPGVKIVDVMLTNALGNIDTVNVVAAWGGLLNDLGGGQYEAKYPNVKVVSNSWSGLAYHFNVQWLIDDYQPIRPVLNGLFAAGMSVVFSAGNSGTSFSEPSLTMPAAMDSRIITVGASAPPPWRACPAPFTNFANAIPGFTYPADIQNPEVTVMALGMWVLAPAPWYALPSNYVLYGRKPDNPLAGTERTDTYTIVDGTSFSCPIVSGVVALVRTVNPALTPVQVKEIIRDSADKLRIRGFGGGQLNMTRALIHAEQTLPTPPARFYARSWATPAPLRGTFDMNPTLYSPIESGWKYHVVGNTLCIWGDAMGIQKTVEPDGSLGFSWSGTDNNGGVSKYLGTFSEHLPQGTLTFWFTFDELSYCANTVVQYLTDGTTVHTAIQSGFNSVPIRSDACSWYFCVTASSDGGNPEDLSFFWTANVKDITFTSTDQTPSTVVGCDVMTSETVNSVALVLDGVQYAVQTVAPYDFVVPDATLAAATAKEFKVVSTLGTRYVEYDSEYVPQPFTPPAGSYQEAQTVALTGTGDIYYTLDGSTPTAETGTLYTAPVIVPFSETPVTLKFIDDTAVVQSATYEFYLEGSLAAPPVSLQPAVAAPSLEGVQVGDIAAAPVSLRPSVATPSLSGVSVGNVSAAGVSLTPSVTVGALSGVVVNTGSISAASVTLRPFVSASTLTGVQVGAMSVASVTLRPSVAVPTLTGIEAVSIGSISAPSTTVQILVNPPTLVGVTAGTAIRAPNGEAWDLRDIYGAPLDIRAIA